MTMSLDAAAQVMREAMRETVRWHSLWYLIQGGVMVLAGSRKISRWSANGAGVQFLRPALANDCQDQNRALDAELFQDPAEAPG